MYCLMLEYADSTMAIAWASLSARFSRLLSAAAGAATAPRKRAGRAKSENFMVLLGLAVIYGKVDGV